MVDVLVLCMGVTKGEGTLTKGYVGLRVELMVDILVLNRRGVTKVEGCVGLGVGDGIRGRLACPV